MGLIAQDAGGPKPQTELRDRLCDAVRKQGPSGAFGNAIALKYFEQWRSRGSSAQ